MRRREFIGLRPVRRHGRSSQKLRPTDRMRRIGVLFGATEGDPQVTKYLGAFSSGLRQLGWIEGRNIEIDYRWARGDIERARSLAKELVSTSPALILTTGTEPALALRETTATVPVVFINVTDPVAGGLVASLARPSGNITGFTPFEYDIERTDDRGDGEAGYRGRAGSRP